MAKSSKKKAWEWCSKYVRLREALDYCKKYGISLKQFTRPEDIIGKCCTCGTVKSWIYMDCGHCIGRGIGGSSGVYFNTQNLALQCKRCNGFLQGCRKKFEEHLKDMYGNMIIETLELAHHTKRYSKPEIIALGEHFKSEYEKLKESIK